MQTLLWDDEVREARFPELDELPNITAAELKMSKQLVESFASDFQPEKFSDDYQEQLRTLVEAKLEQGDALDTEATFGRETDGGGEVLDLMEALKRSVAASKPAAKKAPAKKASSAAGGAKKSRAKAS
jgi:DNA end-binding protein Ku